MRIIQLLPTLGFGDAIGNDALALANAIKEFGYETKIIAEAVDARHPKGTATDLCSGYPELFPDDIILYHMSTGTRLNYELEKLNGRKMLIYHNITPPHFFNDYNPSAAVNAQTGLNGLKHLAGKVEYCMADSEFNKQDLIAAGFNCPIDVRPILIPFDDYKKTPDRKVLDRMKDGYTNILFVGRIAPNKKQENVIASFCWYKKHINPKSRLILAGSSLNMESYCDRLKNYVSALELEDVIFTGHIPFAEILAYYASADVFLCMSEHEGFCVPLVEAMFFDLPIIALNSCAVPDTLGGSGLLTDSADPVETALLIDRVVTDSELRSKVIEGQRKRLEDFSYENIKVTFRQILEKFISEGK